MSDIGSPRKCPCRLVDTSLCLTAVAFGIILAVCWSSAIWGDEVATTNDVQNSEVVKPEFQAQDIPPVFSQYQLDSIRQPSTERIPFVSNLKWNSQTTFRLRGRFEVDSIAVNQSSANNAAFGDLPDTTGLRRARIGAEGNFTATSRYVAEIDLASGDVVIRDALVGLGPIQETGELKFGHMREPFSLEGGTSANTLAFMERSPINDLDPARNWGIGFAQCSSDEDATIALGLFKSGANANDFGIGNGSDTAATAKVTGLLWHENGGARLMHFGMATSSRVPDNQLVVINQRPASPLLDLGDSSASPFVSKINISAAFQQLFNAQWASVDGPLWSQAEWYGTLVDQSDNHSLFLHGGYLAAGYFLTGEHRDYQKRSGVMGPLMVARPFVSGFASGTDLHQQGCGAWELAARISYLDFSDSHLPAGPQGQNIGTRLPQATIGINWYLADRLRIMFDYTCSAPDESNSGVTTANMFATRFAMFW